MTTQELVNYYANLLILQYIGEPKAYATIQAVVTQALMPQTTVYVVALSDVAASGTFKFTYGAQSTAAINWNDSAATIQAALQALTGLGSATVTGSIASKTLTVTMTGVAPVALALGVTANSLLTGGGVAITFAFTETDVILPLAIQDAFNLSGTVAAGVQLDVLGKYVGVARTGVSTSGVPITLSDVDFLQLINLAIVSNNSGSSLATIESLLNQFFPNEIFVFDYKNMRMAYMINSSVGSQDLAQLFVTKNLLPKPMGVQLGITVYAANVNSFFNFRSYDFPIINGEPFNTYDVYNTNWPWLSYADGLGV